MRFFATHVEACAEDDDYLASVWLADKQPGEGITAYVAMCRSMVPGEEDADVYIERDDQAWATYGGIRACRLYRRRLEIDLDGRAARRLQLDAEDGAAVIVDFDLPPEPMDQVRPALAAIFKGRPEYHCHDEG